MNTQKLFDETTGAVKGATGAFTTPTRKLIYAGLGSVAVLAEETGRTLGAFQKEANQTFETLVEEGRKVERGTSKTMVGTVYTQAGRRVKTVEDEAVQGVEVPAETVAKEAQETMAGVLHRYNVPTREDVRALKASVERLNEKVNRIRAEIRADQ